MTYVAPDTPPAPEFPERPDGVQRAAPPGGSRRWPVWAAPTALIAAFVAGNIVGLLVAVVAAIGGADVFEKGKETPPGVAIAGAYALALVFVATAVLFARMSGPAGPADFGLRGTRFWRAVGLTIGAYIGFVVVAILWFALVGTPGEEEVLDTLGVERSTLLLVLGAIAVCIFAPIGEEFLFRGFMYPALRNGLGVAWAAALTGALFGVVHGFSAEVEALVPLAVFGAALCLLYQATGSLYPCIALHAINNAIALGGDKEWDWQIAPLALGALVLSVGVAMLAARLWRPSGP